MTDEEIIAVVTAKMEGKTIEYRHVEEEEEKDWEVIARPLWNFPSCDYRVKPEPHYRPFKNAEEVMEAIKEHGDWVKQKNNGCYVSIRSFDCEFVAIGNYTMGATYSSAFESVIFADGTPFGVKEEEE